MPLYTEGMKRALLIALGWLSVAIGIAGIFLPLVPTVPLLLLAAWCFTRSSQRAHRWLFNHPKLGPVVRQWAARPARL